MKKSIDKYEISIIMSQKTIKYFSTLKYTGFFLDTKIKESFFKLRLKSALFQLTFISKEKFNVVFFSIIIMNGRMKLNSNELRHYEIASGWRV